MSIKYICPYCGQNSYAKSSNKSGNFASWKDVRAHTSRCSKNTGEYTIDEFYGSIHWLEFTKDKYYIINTYPQINNLANITNIFRKKGYLITNY